MGVKEYRFLTKTMKTISARSNKLEKANSLLTKTDNSLKDTRSSERSVGAKVKRAEVSKQSTSDSSHRSEWGSLSSMKKEIKATKSKLKTEEETFAWGVANRWNYFLDEKFAECLKCDGTGTVGKYHLKRDCPDCHGSGDSDRTLGDNRRGPLWLFQIFIGFPFIFFTMVVLFYPGNEPIPDDAAFLLMVVPIIITVFMTKSFVNYSNKKFMPYHEIQSKLNVLRNREEILKKEENKRRRSNSKLMKLKNELSELESDIEDSVKLRDSTKKEIKLLEKEIAPLWDSIAHLIPFSTALEKA